jgi:putative toxin-antitoxin system antitoxin component (TIGR02293 family)
MARPAERLTEADVRDGLPVSALANVSTALDISTTELIDWLQISPRTWARRKAAGRFDALESDRLARLIRLVRRATTVVGSEIEARDWLTAPAPALDRRNPLEVAATEIGAERVFQLLGRIEHGVFT